MCGAGYVFWGSGGRKICQCKSGLARHVLCGPDGAQPHEHGRLGLRAHAVEGRPRRRRPYTGQNRAREVILSPKTLDAVLKRIREAKGLSQLDSAKRAKVSQGYLSDLEARQKKNPGIETLRKIAKALGVPVAELLG